MTRSRKILIGLFALVVLAVVVSGPGSSIPSAGDLTTNAKEDRAAAQAAKEQVNTAKKATGDPDGFASELSAARAAVPPTPQLGNLITAIEQIVTETGLTWSSGAPTRSSGEDGSAWGMSMRVKGSPDKVVTLLDKLQSMPRLVVVDTLTMQGTTPDETDTTLTLRFFSTPGDLDGFTPEERSVIETALNGDATSTDGAPVTNDDAGTTP